MHQNISLPTLKLAVSCVAWIAIKNGDMPSPQRQLHLAAYDISCRRRRTGALRLMRAYATGGQKSVLEMWLTPAGHRQLVEEMAHILGDDDRFMLLRLDPHSRGSTLGRGTAPENPDYFYIG